MESWSHGLTEFPQKGNVWSFSGVFMRHSPSCCIIKQDCTLPLAWMTSCGSSEFLQSQSLSHIKQMPLWSLSLVHSRWRKHVLRQRTDSSYHVFPEASHCHHVFDNRKINLNVTLRQQSPLRLFLNYYIMKLFALALDIVETFLQDWNTIRHLQSSCFLWV